MKVRREVESRGRPPILGKPRLSSSVGHLVEAARREAVLFGHACIGSEHLLAAFLRDETSLLAAALREHGREPNEVLLEMGELLAVSGATGTDATNRVPRARRLRKEDFPSDVQADPLLDLFLRAEAGMSDTERARNPFVRAARRRCPKTVEELAQYTVDEYVEAIRAVQETEQDQKE
jgi:hypothetical protein